ncbi:uncharacterized protein PFL1_04064 [Pseudozyma flocculosa PF-1]|uniref:Cyclin-domain-containing protein n=2 Tax=Pseudozyma flocculosa TaxID=84751 RepID=A0A5C3ESQ0_9BASI|nr:uncharacterized protein PFL1_04064 [Pseudozyma flocculosa PF-1]EPQ28237.1 hypothetical protein PFL1_04064 [Pseudozyma flocculosa PF-1]SPO35374.1 uncharacterized protein PSFLO_00845 [Pseudozyma flocculosa]
MTADSVHHPPSSSFAPSSSSQASVSSASSSTSAASSPSASAAAEPHALTTATAVGASSSSSMAAAAAAAAAAASPTPSASTSRPPSRPPSRRSIKGSHSRTVSAASRAGPPPKHRKVLPYLFDDAELDDVVVLVADMLTKLTQHNDSLPLHPASLTRFHSRATPNISLPAYLRRIAKYTSVEKCCMLILLVYIDRVCERMAGFTICGLTVHRFVCAAVLCASKALCDAFNTNEHYSRVGGITLAEMNLLEKEFLNIIDWRLTCSGDLLQHYYASLVRSHDDFVLDLPPSNVDVDSVSGTAAMSLQAQDVVGGDEYDDDGNEEARGVAEPSSELEPQGYSSYRHDGQLSSTAANPAHPLAPTPPPPPDPRAPLSPSSVPASSSVATARPGYSPGLRGGSRGNSSHPLRPGHAPASQSPSFSGLAASPSTLARYQVSATAAAAASTAASATSTSSASASNAGASPTPLPPTPPPTKRKSFERAADRVGKSPRIGPAAAAFASSPSRKAMAAPSAPTNGWQYAMSYGGSAPPPSSTSANGEGILFHP